MFKFLLTLFTDIITPVYSSTQIYVASCVYNMKFINFYIACRKKSVFFYKEFILYTIWNIPHRPFSAFTVDHYCIMLETTETNKYIYRNGYVLGCWL